MSPSAPTLQFQTDFTAEQAFFQKKVGSLLCILYQNERPLTGLAGTVDWRIQGQISHLLLKGQITGKLGERIYLPVRSPSGDSHSRLFLVGAGVRKNPTKSSSRTALSEDVLKSIKTGFGKIGVGPIGISQTDFEETTETFYRQWFGQLPFWVFR